MAEQKMISEREAVMRERRAFRLGFDFAAYDKNAKPHEYPEHACAICDSRTTELFPLPKVTRPRVVTHGSSHWRYVDGGFQWSLTGEKWESPDTSWIMRPSLVVVLAGLVNEPTEEVEDV